MLSRFFRRHVQLTQTSARTAGNGDVDGMEDETKRGNGSDTPYFQLPILPPLLLFPLPRTRFRARPCLPLFSFGCESVDKECAWSGGMNQCARPLSRLRFLARPHQTNQGL